MLNGLISNIVIFNDDLSNNCTLTLGETLNHLIVVGNNGSGKTSILKLIADKLLSDYSTINSNSNLIEIAYIGDQPCVPSIFINKFIHTEKLISIISDKINQVTDVPIIVVVDAIDAYLDLEMQKKILPKLTDRFPRAQLIISTYSPFVVTSKENAVVYNLTNKKILNKPNLHSYQSVIENFFDLGTYSIATTSIYNRYRQLFQKELTIGLTDKERDEISYVSNVLSNTPISSSELYFSFIEMEGKRMPYTCHEK